MTPESIEGANSLQKKEEGLRGHGYSWGRIARLRTESQYESLYAASSEDMLVVDLCSSFPQYREIMRGRHARKMLHEAREVVTTFVNVLTGPPKDMPQFIARLNQAELRALRARFSDRHGEDRTRLVGTVFDVLNNPPPTGSRKPEIVGDLIYKNSKTNRYPVEVFEPDGDRYGKGNWVHVGIASLGTPLKRRIQSVLGDANYSFFRGLSLFLAQNMVEKHKLRQVEFVSLDCEPIEVLAQEAEKAFPDRIKKTLFFLAGKNKERHKVANLLEELPFEPESVDLFTSVEGWPYYFRDTTRRDNFQLAARITSRLKPGGKAVFFPWQMDEVSYGPKVTLDAVENQWKKEGMMLEKEEIARAQLMEEMTDRELVLAEHSPLLRHKGPFINLTVTKPLAQAA